MKKFISNLRHLLIRDLNDTANLAEGLNKREADLRVRVKNLEALLAGNNLVAELLAVKKQS